MNIQLSHKEISLIISILNKNLLNVEVWVFGSRATCKAKQYSDLDLLLKGKSKIPLLTLSKIEEDFADSALTFKVDLIDWHRISKEFQLTIQNEWIRII